MQKVSGKNENLLAKKVSEKKHLRLRKETKKEENSGRI